jgi:hypothetical protein
MRASVDEVPGLAIGNEEEAARFFPDPAEKMNGPWTAGYARHSPVRKSDTRILIPRDQCLRG